MNTRVLNLSTDQEIFYSCPPKQAVVAAYAQFARHDWNTWTYETRYAHLITTGKHSVCCGDFAALLKEDA